MCVCVNTLILMQINRIKFSYRVDGFHASQSQQSNRTTVSNVANDENMISLACVCSVFWLLNFNVNITSGVCVFFRVSRLEDSAVFLCCFHCACFWEHISLAFVSSIGPVPTKNRKLSLRKKRVVFPWLSVVVVSFWSHTHTCVLFVDLSDQSFSLPSCDALRTLNRVSDSQRSEQ